MVNESSFIKAQKAEEEEEEEEEDEEEEEEKKRLESDMEDTEKGRILYKSANIDSKWS